MLSNSIASYQTSLKSCRINVCEANYISIIWILIRCSLFSFHIEIHSFTRLNQISNKYCVFQERQKSQVFSESSINNWQHADLSRNIIDHSYYNRPIISWHERWNKQFHVDQNFRSRQLMCYNGDTRDSVPGKRGCSARGNPWKFITRCGRFFNVNPCRDLRACAWNPGIPVGRPSPQTCWKSLGSLRYRFQIPRLNWAIAYRTHPLWCLHESRPCAHLFFSHSPTTRRDSPLLKYIVDGRKFSGRVKVEIQYTECVLSPSIPQAHFDLPLPLSSPSALP